MILEIVWSVIAFLGLCRATMLLREAIIDRRALGADTNGRRILANGEVEHAALGVSIYLFILFAGLSALGYRFEVIPLHVRLSLTALALVLMLITLVTRQERDAYYRRRYFGLPPLYDRTRRCIGWAIRQIKRKLKLS